MTEHPTRPARDTPDVPERSADRNVVSGFAAYGPTLISYAAEWVVLALASGIVGNAAYDALKKAVARAIQKRSPQVLKPMLRDDAELVAREAVRIYCESQGLKVDVMALTTFGPLVPTASAGWNLTLVSGHFSFFVLIPHDGAKLGRVRVGASKFEWTRSEAEVLRTIRLEQQKLQEAIEGDTRWDLLQARESLAKSLQSIGRFREAIAEYERFIAEAEKPGSAHGESYDLYELRLRWAKEALERCREAAPLHDNPVDRPVARPRDLEAEIATAEAALAERRRWKFEDELRHPNHVSWHSRVELTASLGLADAYRVSGQYMRAALLYENILQGGIPEPLALVVQQELAECYMSTGKTQRAAAIYSRTLDRCVNFFGPNHPMTLLVMSELGKIG